MRASKQLRRQPANRLDAARRAKLRQVSQARIVENKHLGAVLSHIRERQIERAWRGQVVSWRAT